MKSTRSVTRRKQIADVLAYGLLLCVAGCGGDPSASANGSAQPHKKRPKEILTIAVTASEHAKLLEFVRPLLVPTGVVVALRASQIQKRLAVG